MTENYRRQGEGVGEPVTDLDAGAEDRGLHGRGGAELHGRALAVDHRLAVVVALWPRGQRTSDNNFVSGEYLL